jgi:ketosteroid isomerase-like protein
MSDRSRICDTIGRCFFAYDEGDAETMVDCFVEGAVIRIESDEVRTIEGHAAIAEFCQEIAGRSLGILRHPVTNTFIEKDGDEEATVVSYHMTVLTRDGAPEILQTGWCRDELVLKEDRWKIVRRLHHCDSPIDGALSSLS